MRKKLKSHISLRRALLAFFLWLFFLSYIFFIFPSSILSFGFFYMLLGISLFFSFGAFVDMRRSCLYAAIFLMFLLLQHIHFLNIVTAPIVVGLLVVLEIYFRKF